MNWVCPPLKSAWILNLNSLASKDTDGMSITMLESVIDVEMTGGLDRSSESISYVVPVSVFTIDRAVSPHAELVPVNVPDIVY